MEDDLLLSSGMAFEEFGMVKEKDRRQLVLQFHQTVLRNAQFYGKRGWQNDLTGPRCFRVKHIYFPK